MRIDCWRKKIINWNSICRKVGRNVFGWRKGKSSGKIKLMRRVVSWRGINLWSILSSRNRQIKVMHMRLRSINCRSKYKNCKKSWEENNRISQEHKSWGGDYKWLKLSMSMNAINWGWVYVKRRIDHEDCTLQVFTNDIMLILSSINLYNNFVLWKLRSKIGTSIW